MKRRLLAILITATAIAAAQSREKRLVPVAADLRGSFERQPKVAVLAGIGQYPSRSGFSRLRYPAHDVDLLEAELSKQGYKVVALKDQEGTRGSIEQALRDAAELADHGKGTVLFFFSGHGFADKGENYLAPFEAASGDLAGSGLAVKRVEALLKATGAPRQIIFVDACRNEPGKAVGSRSFERFQASAGLRELFSTKAGRISYENDTLGSGVFTHFLVRGLQGEAAGQDGLITFRDLAEYVTETVSAFGFQRGQMQVPYEGGESSGDFLIAGPAPGLRAPAGSAAISPGVGAAAPPVAAPVIGPKPGTVKSPAPKSQAELTAIQTLFTAQQANNLDGVIKAADELLTKFADTEFKELAFYMEAEAYSQKGDNAKAQVYSEQALALNPQSYQASIILAELLGKQTRENDLDREEKLGKVEKYSKGAIEYVKDAPKPNSQVTDDQWAEYKKGIVARAHNAMGMGHLVRRKYEAAVVEFQLAVDNDPQPAFMVRQASALQSAGRNQEASALCDKVLAGPNLHPVIKQATQQIKALAVKK